jgi:hypothetical protein
VTVPGYTGLYLGSLSPLLGGFHPLLFWRQQPRLLEGLTVRDISVFADQGFLSCLTMAAAMISLKLMAFLHPAGSDSAGMKVTPSRRGRPPPAARKA